MGLKLANIFSQDLDDLFAYNTRICIILQSQGIGIFYRILQLIAVIYITAIVTKTFTNSPLGIYIRRRILCI